jgi:ribosomal protein L11 methyltransferase
MESFVHLYPMLVSAGQLLISGFYTSDLPYLKQEAEKNGFVFKSSTEQNNWCAALFIK